MSTRSFLFLYKHCDVETLLGILESSALLELIWEDCLKEMKCGHRYLDHRQKLQYEFGYSDLIDFLKMSLQISS